MYFSRRDALNRKKKSAIGGFIGNRVLDRGWYAGGPDSSCVAFTLIDYQFIKSSAISVFPSIHGC